MFWEARSCPSKTYHTGRGESKADARPATVILHSIINSDFENCVSSPPASFFSCLRVRLTLSEIDEGWSIYQGYRLAIAKF